jgi:hypothetical protein
LLPNLKGATVPDWGQIKIWAGHYYDPPSHDKVYVVWIDDCGGNNPYVVSGGYDKRINEKRLRVQPHGEFSSMLAAERKMELVVREKTNKGYHDIRSAGYNPKLWTMNDAMKRIDTSRLCGFSQTKPVVAVEKPVTVKTHNIKHGSGRVDRSIDF